MNKEVERSESGDGDEGDEEVVPDPFSKWGKGRIIIAYWLLGMCNNYIYVVMLSAAHDIITIVDPPVNLTDIIDFTENNRECNDLSTGAILLADILPTLAVKTVFPFLPFFVQRKLFEVELRLLIATELFWSNKPVFDFFGLMIFCSSARIAFSVTTGIISLLLVAYADTLLLALIGVAFASFNCGLGEVTLLAYSTLYPLFSIAAWSSGTGGAGIIGAFMYASMTEAGLTPSKTLLISIAIPILFGVSFWIIMKSPAIHEKPSDIATSAAHPTTSGVESGGKHHRMITAIEQFNNDLAYIPKLLHYMIPIGLVYFFEYLINSGLYELLEFENSPLEKNSQFRWYNFMYQFGVFISRSSVSWIHFDKIWIMSILQGINVLILTADAIYGFIPNIWFMFAFIFWEGLLGGAAYVNTFYNMSYQVPKDKRLFALSIASVADTIGIISAGLIAFPLHDAICQLPHDPMYRWPT